MFGCFVGEVSLHVGFGILTALKARINFTGNVFWGKISLKE
jgi:hypothetical protein